MVEWCLVFENTEGDVEEFAHDGAADGQGAKFSFLEQGNPGPERFTPSPGDSGRQIKGFAQERVANFGEVGFAVGGDPGPELRGSQSGVSS
jgi:hypothetical protein